MCETRGPENTLACSSSRSLGVELTMAVIIDYQGTFPQSKVNHGSFINRKMGRECVTKSREVEVIERVEPHASNDAFRKAS